MAIWTKVLGAALLASLGLNAFMLSRAGAPSSVAVWDASLDQFEVLRTEGGLLQVSTIRAPETFTATQPHNVLGVDLGATVTQLRVPATFHYHIALAPEWKMRVRPDGVVVVVAPAVQPTLPVGIDTARLEQHSRGVWSLVTGPSQQKQLLSRLTAELEQTASRTSYIKFQREAARRTVEEFVRKWMLKQGRASATTPRQVRVLFADEPISELPDLALPMRGVARS